MRIKSGILLLLQFKTKQKKKNPNQPTLLVLQNLADSNKQQTCNFFVNLYIFFKKAGVLQSTLNNGPQIH